MTIKSLGPQFQVNTTTAGGQSRIHTAELSNGNLVAYWHSGEPLESDDWFDYGDVIRARVFDVSGRPLTRDFTVNQEQFWPHDVEMKALDDGGFVFTWDTDGGTGGGFSDYLGPRIRAFEADGRPHDDEQVISGTQIGGGGSVIELADGRFLSTWGGSDIGARILTERGEPTGTNIQVNNTESAWEHVPLATALPNGGFAIAWNTDLYWWRDPAEYPEGMSVRARVFDAAGKPVGPDVLLNTSTTGAMDGSIQSLEVRPNGAILATFWTDAGIKGRLIDMDGKARGDEFAYTPPPAPQGTELADGRWMETWQGEGAEAPLMAQMKSAANAPLSSVFTIYADGFFGVEPMSDGRVLLIGSDVGPYNRANVDARIFAKFFDATQFHGTAAADFWTGGTMGDEIRGAGGNDRLFGGAGNDRVFGGSGDDRLFGGAGKDMLVGKPGDDRLFGGAGNDRLMGSKGSDTLVGQGGKDLLLGQGGNDLLRGHRGNDLLVGGAGADTLVGGSGRDTFRFETVRDSRGAARDAIRSGDGAAAFEGAGRAAGDMIDVSRIDARQATAADDAFIFGGRGEGHLWTVNSGGKTIVRANIDGDAAVEFQLVIADGGVRASAYSGDDFFL